MTNRNQRAMYERPMPDERRDRVGNMINVLVVGELLFK
uniref:Uncharacterized protein n=1 Tax=viral metagenome TaxID=1070528 RepID=A0A6C0BU27_9ZZZZ